MVFTRGAAAAVCPCYAMGAPVLHLLTLSVTSCPAAGAGCRHRLGRAPWQWDAGGVCTHVRSPTGPAHKPPQQQQQRWRQQQRWQWWGRHKWGRPHSTLAYDLLCLMLRPPCLVLTFDR
jgi:hypothetical protein